MKQLFTCLALLIATAASAQDPCAYYFTFEVTDSGYLDHVFIDTADTNNIWQIGTPSKNVFNSAYNGPFAIVTDTTNPYPVNDTSSFTISVPRLKPIIGAPYWPFLFEMYFSYQLDIDNGDLATIEISEDTGQNWTNISSLFQQNSSDFTTSTAGWIQAYGYGLPILSQDTIDILIRFTFISDSVVSTKDGMIIDDIRVGYWCESSVKTVAATEPVTIYPNPSDGNIKLHSTQVATNVNIQITDLSGQKICQANSTSEDLHLNLPDGLYLLHYSDSQTTSTQKLIILH